MYNPDAPGERAAYDDDDDDKEGNAASRWLSQVRAVLLGSPLFPCCPRRRVCVLLCVLCGPFCVRCVPADAPGGL